MCGRYVAVADRSKIERQFDAKPVDGEALAPDFNVAPTKKVYAVLDRHDERELKIVRWGLIPSWAKDPKIGSRMINARLESAASKPSFRAAWKKRRALIPADGYYEWYTPQTGPDSPTKPAKQPYYIHPRDGSLMSMAGLYEIWRDPTVADDDDPMAFRWTCTILTTSATDDLGRIHDRMPLLVAPEHMQEWLDSENPAPSQEILVPAAPGLLEAYPVSTEVNRVSNNNPHLIDPLPIA